MSSFTAKLAAKRRAPVMLSLGEMDALLTATGQPRYASRNLRSGLHRLQLARERRQRAVSRAARP